jgi:hypothetical protein
MLARRATVFCAGTAVSLAVARGAASTAFAADGKPCVPDTEIERRRGHEA